MKAIKGFDKDLKCRGFAFQIGKTYRHEGKVEACRGGFHAVPEDAHPLSVFEYYAPAGSRFCVVEVDGTTDRDGDKIAAEILTVGREVGLGDLATEAVSWVMARATPEGKTAERDNGLATASGDQGAATASGYRGAATASGYQGAATASGEMSCAMATGPDGRVMGEANGVDLFAREIVWNRQRYERLSIACGTTGRDGIKAGVWYCCKGGKLVEAAA